MKTALCALLFSCALILLPAYAQASASASPGGTPPSNPPAAAMPNNPVRHPGPCHDDVQKFCGNVKKGGGLILACLKEHEGQLSPRCEAGMKRHASGQSPAPAQGMAAPSNAAPPAK